ncbi:hypothetical protein FKW77_004393 [Venturia effusa]|uniref:Integral membrane protein n=1 Tax=Venturia effusa TaxID=50376 RepID=A0A517LAW3_9PEZI|nr:hypothetical protein FKW77_004393 [Venturia effusa]
MPPEPRALSSRLFLTLLSFSTLIHAQVGQILDRSKLPACAFNCALLTQAQSLCVPPTAPTADPGIYQSCFCNSNYLAPFRAGGTAGVCDAECTSATDLSQIQQWFKGLCTSGVVVIPNDAVAATGTAAGSAATGTPSSVSSSSGSNSGHKSWIEQHYRWVIMVVVLFIAALVGILVGLYFKRKYDRKQALGGHTRGSMLAADEAARHVTNSHATHDAITRKPAVERHDGIEHGYALIGSHEWRHGQIDTRRRDESDIESLDGTVGIEAS